MLSSSGEIIDSDYYLKNNDEGGACRDSAPISDEESWETPTSPEKNSTDIEKCERELAETDKKIQQLQLLSNSVVDHSMSLLNHNTGNEEAFKADNTCIGEQGNNFTEIKNCPDHEKNTEVISTYENSNHFASCSHTNTLKTKKVGGDASHFNSSVMQDGHISPVPVQIQQLTC